MVVPQNLKPLSVILNLTVVSQAIRNCGNVETSCAFFHLRLHFLAQDSCSLCILCSLDYPAPQRIPLGTTNSTLRFMEYYELNLRSSVHFRTYAPSPSSRTENTSCFSYFLLYSVQYLTDCCLRPCVTLVNEPLTRKGPIGSFTLVPLSRRTCEVLYNFSADRSSHDAHAIMRRTTRVVSCSQSPRRD